MIRRRGRDGHPVAGCTPLPAKLVRRDIFERFYAVRLDRLRELADYRAVLKPLDRQGLLAAAPFEPPPVLDDLDDDALLAALGVDVARDDIAELRHVRSAADKRSRPRHGDFNTHPWQKAR